MRGYWVFTGAGAEGHRARGVVRLGSGRVRGGPALGTEFRGGAQAGIAVGAVLLHGRAALGAELPAGRDLVVAVAALDRRGRGGRGHGGRGRWGGVLDGGRG